MNAFLDRPSVSAIRRIARIFGTLGALIALFGMMEDITEGRTILEHLTVAGFLLIFVGGVVGWFKDLPAAVLILGGILLSVVTSLASPGYLHWISAAPMKWLGLAFGFAIFAIPGLLYLYVYLVSKKEKRAHETQG
jgi:hypothetical protein